MSVVIKSVVSRLHSCLTCPAYTRTALAATLVVAGVLSSTLANAQVNVTTYHNDIGRTGQNLNETILTPSNVNATQFGKLFEVAVDGDVYAQPLYLSGITVNGATHNVVYVATENDSVYAFDADSNGGSNSTALWQASMLTAAHGAAAGATTISSNIVSTDISPQVGITGTPVIDPSTGTLYVVSATYENNAAVQRLHALDVTTGAEKFGGPVVITASVPGTGNGSVNGVLTFDKLWENQRPGLLLLNGIVWIGFASHGDNGPWHGWILGYNASTLQQTGAFCSSPNGTGAGFWMSGEGLAADQLDPVNKPFGRMFVPTGNGDYTATTPYTNNMDYGDSQLNLDLTNGVPTITDEFTTNQQANLNSQDGDIASGGLMVLPTQTTGSYPHLAVQAGKGGTLYLLNRDNMGGYNTTKDQAVQEQAYSVGNVGVWSTPAYWNGNVYYWGRVDNLKSFPLVNGLLSTTPTKSTEQYGYPGATPSISASGNTQGIVWTIDSEAYGSNGPSILQAHDASNVASLLYTSTTNSSRDAAGPAVKFTLPTVANGKVYVGAGGELDVYGLLNGATQTATPTFNPASESYSGTISVSIADATPNSTIYYTTDGSKATTASTVYTGPIAVSTSETINAVASATGTLTSAQASATYSNVSQVTTVVFSLPTGTYTSTQSVSLSDNTANATIYYTTDGSTPTTSSTLYTGPITVSSTETITAIAVATGLKNSNTLAQTYTINAGATGISFTQGFASSTGLVILNGYSALNDSRLQLTNGLVSEASSAWYYQPVGVQTFTSDFTFQLSNPNADGITFAIQNASQGTAALGGNGSNLGYGGINKSVAIKFDLYNSAGEGSDSTGLYLNGAAPTTPAIDLTSTGINLHSDDAMAVHLTYDGTTLTMTITDMVTTAVWSTSWTVNIPSTVGGNTAYVGFTGGTGSMTASQKILTWSYTTQANSAAGTPTFTPAAGSYTSPQTVAITSATSAASIYYTTDGSTPTTSSTPYTAAVTVGSTETLKAIATATGYTTSAVGSAAYTITNTAAQPTFSLAAGTYSSAQSVTISDTTAGATIYYTTNGSTPTTGSNVYSGAITVSASETLQAIAVATGYSNSAVASAAYTITATAAAPTFSIAAGTYTTSQTVSISDSSAGASIYYTVNGSTPTPSASLYTGPITVNTTETVKAIASGNGFATSAVASATYTITPPAATPTFSVAAGTYTSTQTVTISDTSSGASIYYTVNGSTPNPSTGLYTGPITVSSSETVQAIASGNGFSSSPVASATYTITPPAATPTFSVAAGSYTSTQTVAISDTSSGASIYYTVNGSTPTPSASIYTGPITVSASETVKAIASGNGFSISPVASAAYTITPPAATPTFSVAAGTYTTTQTVTLSDATTGAAIYYTLNGTNPTTSSTLYSGAITVSTTETIKAIATATNYSASAVASAAYTIKPVVATPTFSLAAGNYTGTQTVTLSDATAGATIYYTVNGSTPTTSSTVYSGAISVTASETINAIAAATNYANSAVASAAYTISTAAPAPVFSLGTGTYNYMPVVTVTDSAPNAAIYFTVDGTTPTTSSSLYSGPLTIRGTKTLQAIAVVSGLANSSITSAVYTLTASAPVFSTSGGNYTGPITVTLSSATPNSTIYYTTAGNLPTTSSPHYTGPITVSAKETIKALTGETGFNNSAVISNSYTFTTSTATPTFSPAAGTYASTQTVTISDATSGSVIYYTTDGSTPTTSSAVYSGPVTVSASGTLNALAVASGSSSSVGTAAYTIAPPTATPTFSPAAGTYYGSQTVAISDATPGTVIYYTLDGSTPTTNSTIYSGPLTVAATKTINAIAVASGTTVSSLASAAYTISTTANTIDYSGGFTSVNINPVGGATISNGTLQLTDGNSGEQRGAWFKAAVSVQAFTTDFTFQATSATADGFTFALQNSSQGIYALGTNGVALGYGGIGNSVAVKFDLYNNNGEGSDSTGFYTNGATPSLPSVDMTNSGINLHSGDLMHAHITYDGTTLTLTITDTVTNGTFTTSTAINIPSTIGSSTAYVGFTGGTGGKTSIQNVLTWTYAVN